MKKTRPALAEFVIAPELTLAMAYFLVLYLRHLWLHCTIVFPPSGADELRLISHFEFGCLTAINILFMGTIIAAWCRSQHSSPSLQAGQRAGLLVGAIVLALAQTWAVLAHLTLADLLSLYDA